MKKLSIIIVSALFYSLGYAQTIERQVIGSSGMYFSNSSFSISSTLGETFVSTLSGGSIELTEGFQQSFALPADTTDEDSTIGIAQLHNIKINFYPNPFRDVVNVEMLGENDNVTLTIFNANGQKLRNTPLIGGMNRISLKEFSSGMYCFYIDVEGVSKIWKLMKE